MEKIKQIEIMTKLERLQRINVILISRINILSLDRNANSLSIEIFEDRKFSIQKTMWKKLNK